MTPQERADDLVLNHDVTQTVGLKHECPGRARDLIADAIAAAVAEEREACAEFVRTYAERVYVMPEERHILELVAADLRKSAQAMKNGLPGSR